MTELITLTSRAVTLTGSAGEPVAASEDGAAPQVSRVSVGGPICEYEQVANPGGPYSRVRFAQGSIEAPEQVGWVKLLRDHDDRAPIGVMTGVETSGNTLSGTFALGRHPAAIEAAGLVEDQVLDGFSVSVVPLEHHDDNGTRVITRGLLREVSLVAVPAVPQARATVAAAQSTGEVSMNDVPNAAPAVTASSEDLEAMIRRMLDERQAPVDAAPLPVAATGQPTGEPVRPVAGRVTLTNRTQYPTAIGADGRAYTAGDYMVAFADASRNGNYDELRRITAALADETSDDVPGLMPQQIVGNILGTLSGRRPVWDSFSTRPMPMIGAKFSRPKITQHVKVDEQATQKTEVASQKFTLALEEVAKHTFAGALDIAQQAIDWTSPALLNQIVADFTNVYARRVEKYACEFLAAAAKDQKVSWDGNASTLAAAMATAAGKVYGSLGDDADAYPNTIWISSDVWIRIASLTDKNDRPLFPALGATNAFGEMTTASPDRGPNGTGFRWVVGKRLPVETFIVGDADLVESYENGRRFLQAVVPSLLGLDIATMGYAAAYAPYAAALCPIKIGAPAPAPAK